VMTGFVVELDVAIRVKRNASLIEGVTTASVRVVQPETAPIDLSRQAKITSRSPTA